LIEEKKAFMTDAPKMTFTVNARRVDAHGSEADCKDAQITLDTDLAGTMRRKSANEPGQAGQAGDRP
jgi:hypothetical protein